MRNTSAYALVVLCLAICLLAGCGAPSSAQMVLAPAAGAGFSDLSLPAGPADGAPAVISAIDIVMDTTDSMAGFAQSPAVDASVGTAFTRCVSKLIYAAKVAGRSGEVGFFRTDAELLPISEALFRDFDAPAFYIPRRWYTARGMQDALERHAEQGFYDERNIANAAAQADESRVTVLITDLFENGNTNEALISLIKSKYMGGNQSAVLIPIQSEFDGYVYDVFETGDTSAKFYHGLSPAGEAPTFADIGKWEAAVSAQGKDARIDMASLSLTRIAGAPARRPFYLLLLGERKQVNAFAEYYLKLLRAMEGEQVEVGEPILAFDELSLPRLTGTVGAGCAARASTALPEQQLAYARYQDLSASYRGEQVAADELAANRFSYLYRGEANASITVEMQLTLTGDAGGADGLAALRALLTSYELRATVAAYKTAGAGKMILAEYGEDKNYAYYDFEEWALSDAVRAALIRVEGGSFEVAADGLSAAASARVTLDPAALPAGSGIYRFQIDLSLVKVGSVQVGGLSVDEYPWASAWNLPTAGQSAEAWLADAGLRRLNGTINLTNFTQALINAHNKTVLADQEEFPETLAVNRASVDLVVKK